MKERKRISLKQRYLSCKPAQSEKNMERRPPPPSENTGGGVGKSFNNNNNNNNNNNENGENSSGGGGNNTNTNEGETVDVFGGDVWSSGAVLIVVLAWMFKAATERCTC